MKSFRSALIEAVQKLPSDTPEAEVMAAVGDVMEDFTKSTLDINLTVRLRDTPQVLSQLQEKLEERSAMYLERLIRIIGADNELRLHSMSYNGKNVWPAPDRNDVG